MQVLSNARRLNRVLKFSTLLSSNLQIFESSNTCPLYQWQLRNTLSSRSPFSGMVQRNCLETPRQQMYSMKRSTTWFSSQTSNVESTPTDTVKELYDKMLESVNVKRTMPPNAWLWSLIGNCKNHDDIKLLFDILQNLRRFRLSNLRIHENFNCNLCREVTKACVCVGALDFGKRALWKHNVYGLSPTIASAHHLLSYAKDHKDVKLMVEVMKLLKRNELPLQPGTADIVFRICYATNEWELISKYSKRFVKAGVKLRKTTFDTWMDFAAKRGDTESLWQIEKLRSESMNQHTLVTGLSCAKGFLLERKPNEAATIIQVLNQAQTLPDAKKSDFAVELQKVVNEWPLDVMKHRKEEDRKMKYTKPFTLFEEMLKRKVSERGRFLGLDVGDKYVGLSISDANNKIASPLSVLLRTKTNIDLMAEDFRTLISEFNLEGFIVGYPYNRQLNAADVVQVKLLIDNLSATKKLEHVKYTYWNEGFTSKGVELLLKPLNLRPVEHKTILDKFAAVGILQEYLDHANRKVNLEANESDVLS